MPEHYDLIYVITKEEVTAVIDKKYDELSKLEVQQNWTKVETTIRKEIASFQQLSSSTSS